jgi:uncharacterized protein involved in response to NO
LVDLPFIRSQYFRLFFAAPAIFALLQIILMLTAFNFESPKYLKLKGRVAELNEVMGKIYYADQV